MSSFSSNVERGLGPNRNVVTSHDDVNTKNEDTLSSWWSNLLARLSSFKPRSVTEKNIVHAQFDTAESTPSSSVIDQSSHHKNKKKSQVHVMDNACSLHNDRCSNKSQNSPTSTSVCTYPNNILDNRHSNYKRNSDSEIERTRHYSQSNHSSLNVARLRSRSPALPFQRAKKKSAYCTNDFSDPEEEEVTIAQAEKMYARCTWRMYERIMSARSSGGLVCQLQSSNEHLTQKTSDFRCSPQTISIQNRTIKVSNMNGLQGPLIQDFSTHLSSPSVYDKTCLDRTDPHPIFFSFELDD
mmetsp:Transcript_7093/g.10165  ORF Transcript_7093/g.10165 Transcript_7093/m.10165 type:complete len:297 (+) Transcript_7093:331-1221(+)